MSTQREATDGSKPFKLPKSLEIVDFFYDCKNFIRKLFRPSSSKRRYQQQQRRVQPQKEPKDSFIGCVLQIDTSKRGWHRAITTITKNCSEYDCVNFDMDTGLVYVSGIGSADGVLKKLGLSRRAKVVQFKYGQCSKTMFIPPKPKPKSKPEPQSKPEAAPSSSHGGQYPPNHNKVPPSTGYRYFNQQPHGYVDPRYAYQQQAYLGNGYQQQAYLGNGYQQDPSGTFLPGRIFGY